MWYRIYFTKKIQFVNLFGLCIRIVIVEVRGKSVNLYLHGIAMQESAHDRVAASRAYIGRSIGEEEGRCVT